MTVQSNGAATGATTTTVSEATSTTNFVVGNDVYTSGGQQFTMDAQPHISEGHALIPVRYLADALGAQTSWDANTQEITITKGNVDIELTIGSTTLTVNGKALLMDSAPVIKNGRTYLPVRYLAEALGYDISWDAATQTITLS